MLGYLIPMALFVAAFFAIQHFTVTHEGTQTKGRISRKTARRLYWVLGAVVLLWLLSALGVFGHTDPATGNWRPF